MGQIERKEKTDLIDRQEQAYIRGKQMKKSTHRILELANIHEATEKKITLKDVNKAIKSMGYELKKGRGYFYFWPLGDSDMLDKESVAVYRVDGYTLDQWIAELEEKIKESR